MRDTLKRLARLTAGYSLVTLLGPLFTIILTPLYTRVLVPADYAVVDVSLTLSALISLFVILAMDQALGAYFFDGDAVHQRDLVTTAVVCVAAFGLIAASILMIVSTPLAVALFKDPGRNKIMQLLAVNVIAVPIYSVISAALRLQMGIKRVNILGLSFLAATIISNVVLVLLVHLKATGIIAANVIANSFAAALGLFLANQTLRGKFSRELLKPLARAGASLLPGTLSFLLFTNIDRLILTQFVSQSELGLYSIANKLASMLYVLFSAVWNAWWPLALEIAQQPDAKRQYARMFEYISAATMLLALALGLFAPEILSVFTRDVYVPAAPYALILMMYSGPIGFMFGSLQIGLYIRKEVHFVSIGFAVAAAANIALNLLLDSTLGAWGAVIATIVAGVVAAVGMYTFSQRVYPIHYRLPRVLLLGTVYTVLVLTFLLVPALNTFGLKISALIVLTIAISLSGIVTLGQIKQIAQRALYRRASNGL